MGFGVWGVGFRVKGAGFKALVLEYRVQDVRFMVEG